MHPLDLELVVGGIVFFLEVSLDLVDGPADVVAVETDVVGLEDSGHDTALRPCSRRGRRRLLESEHVHHLVSGQDTVLALVAGVLALKVSLDPFQALSPLGTILSGI